jgi:hypothetical protein
MLGDGHDGTDFNLLLLPTGASVLARDNGTGSSMLRCWYTGGEFHGSDKLGERRLATGLQA